MSTFRTSLRIIWGHRLYVAVYLVFISMLGVLAVGGAATSPDSEETGFIAAKPTVAVIDRDGSDISRGITEYVCAQGTSVDVNDDERSIQDAAAEEKPDVEHGLRRGSWTKGPQAEFRSLWHGQGPDDLARGSD